jgi:cytochrome c-type biogenesis protein CcmH
MLSAVTQTYEFDDPKKEQQFEKLIKEFRCVTCPNQNIGDSMAPVASAMREEIYRRVKAGESSHVIRDYLLSQYGDFVLYRPLLKKQTWGLWMGPLVIFMLGIIFWTKYLHQGNRK